MHPLSPHRCLDNIDPLVARFTTPPHSTLSPQLPPPGAIPHPTLPSLCAPPLPSSSPGQRRHPCCCNMWHPLTPCGGLTAPRGYLSLVPSPSPYQHLMWCLTVCWGTCGSHSCFPLLSDLQWSTHPPSSWPSSGTSSMLIWSPAWPCAWSFSSGPWPPASLSRPHGLGLGLYLPCLGCLGVPWCTCGLLPYIPSPPSPFTL